MAIRVERRAREIARRTIERDQDTAVRRDANACARAIGVTRRRRALGTTVRRARDQNRRAGNPITQKYVAVLDRVLIGAE